MKTLSRRDLSKTSLLAPAAAVRCPRNEPHGCSYASCRRGVSPLPTSSAPKTATLGAGRERLLLDFGWRFHLGNANEPDKDFGFGSGRAGNFQKTGNFLPAGAMAFDDGDWRGVDLPHDWAVELPFKNDPALQGKGFYPLGRNYPATSVGWYRRVLEIPAADQGKRITIRV